MGVKTNGDKVVRPTHMEVLRQAASTPRLSDIRVVKPIRPKLEYCYYNGWIAFKIVRDPKGDYTIVTLTNRGKRALETGDPRA